MLTLAFAQGVEGASSQAGQNPLVGLLPIALIFVVFYFLLIRPQKKSQKEHAKMIAELAKNDEVITAGGIHGTVVNIQNDVITLRVDENTRIKVERSSISKIKKTNKEGA